MISVKRNVSLILLVLLWVVSCKKKDTGFSQNLCADFEDSTCFRSNWTVSSDNGSTISFDRSVSYNNSTSLHFTNQYTAGAIDLPSSGMSAYVDCIVANKIYRVSWWGKYKGWTAKDGGPVMYMAVGQGSGVWLDYSYIGVGNGSYVDVDWQQYSFEFTTPSAEPVKLMFGTNIQNCWIDNIQVVLK